MIARWFLARSQHPRTNPTFQYFGSARVLPEPIPVRVTRDLAISVDAKKLRSVVVLALRNMRSAGQWHGLLNLTHV